MPRNTRDSPQIDDIQLAEIHHRFMNMLAMVQAIVRLTNNCNSIEEFQQKVEKRLTALGLVQQVLIESKWLATPLRRLTETMLAPYNGHASKKRFHIHGNDYDVWPEAAMLLSFASNELATNSAKYGALSHPVGYVDVGWLVDEELRTLTFNWRDVDGPPVAPPLRQGFGTTFIRRKTEELNGKLTMTYEPHGAACTICVPLPDTARD